MQLKREMQGRPVLLYSLFYFGKYTDKKKKIKFSSYIRKFRVEQLQSHIWGKASQYMRKCANISPYMRRLLVIYDFTTFLIYEENLIFFFITVLLYHLPKDSRRKDAEVASLVGRKPRLVVRACTVYTVPSMAAAQWILSVRQPGEQKASWMKSQPQNYHRRFNGVLEL